jgi:ATP-dependent DNA helicase RecG
VKETVIKHPDRPEAERFWNFPRVAIEEAIVNAVYHRSYEEREPVEVRITPEDLVVLSFPGPDRSIPMQDLRAGKAVSRRYRNRRIGEFLKELDLTEGRSTGIPKILRAMKDNGSPPPEFESDEDRSYLLIRLPVHVGAERPTPRVTPHVTRPGARLWEGAEGERRRDELQERLDITNRKYFRKVFLTPAMEAGLLEMTDPGSPRSRQQRYRLTPLGMQLKNEL